MSETKAKIGVIGGTGLYQVDDLTNKQEININTPFGKPSDSILIGSLKNRRVAFLPRHGKDHSISPSEIPSRANIWALKSLGVEHIIAINSVGSFKKEIKGGDLLIPDQLIDRTRLRQNTFFGDGIVAHIQFADPFCPYLRRLLSETAERVGADIHHAGTYVVMEGPAFSTRAESKLHRSWGSDIIGMTALPEAKLAKEAEMCYAIIACATDYDSWHEAEVPVSVEMILETMQQQEELCKNIIKFAVERIPENRNCGCDSSLQGAIVTPENAMPVASKERLQLLIKKYLKG